MKVRHMAVAAGLGMALAVSPVLGGGVAAFAEPAAATYANFEKKGEWKTYTVYDADTGEPMKMDDGSTNRTVTAPVGSKFLETVSGATPEKDGYEFVGWSWEQNSSLLKDGAEALGNFDRIYAHFEKKDEWKKYTVYDADTGEPMKMDDGSDRTVTAIVGDPFLETVSGATPEKDGYEFVGWSWEQNWPLLQDGAEALGNFDRIYAHFEKKDDWQEYTVYDADTGEPMKMDDGSDRTVTALVGSEFLETVSGAVPYKEGYKFVGWSWEQNWPLLQDGAEALGNFNYVYAHFEKLADPIPTRTVTFHDKWGNPLCTTANPGDVKFLEYVKLFAQSHIGIPHIHGYVFDGWVTKSGDRILFDDIIATNLDVYASYRKAPKPPVQPDDPDVPNIPQEDCPSEDFIDVDQGLWYHEAIDWAIENGVMTGYDATHFGPNDVLTRAQVARVLYNMAGQPKVDGSTIDDTFTDCGADDWYADAVVWAVENGIFTGYEDGEFGPNDAISREQIAVVFWRLQGEPQSDNDLSTFPDGAKVSDWATEAVEWANEKGLLKGYDTTGELNPTGGLTRAECATVTMRYVDMFGMEL